MYSFRSVRDENDEGIGKQCYCHIGCCYNEAHLGVKNVRDNDQNKYSMKVVDAENTNEFKVRKTQNDCTLVLKDFHEERKDQLS